MRVIGINKQLDKLGRIVIPKDIRDFYCIETGDTLEILSTDEGILIRKQGYKVIKVTKQL